MAYVFHDLDWPDLPKKQVKTLTEDQAKSRQKKVDLRLTIV